MLLDLFLSPVYPPQIYILFLKINEKPVDLGVFMGVMSLHFSKLAINIITLLNTVLLA